MEIEFRYWVPSMKKMFQWQEIEKMCSESVDTKKEGQFVYEHKDVVQMLFTGLKDKNNNKIFEGDVLDFDESEWGGQFNPEAIEMNKLIGKFEYCGTLSDVSQFRKVIGNIYENPELLR